MYAAKKFKEQKEIKEAKEILATSSEVKDLRVSLEQETEASFNAFAQGKQKVVEMAHMKYLD